jgi:hypothetical protein
MRIITKILDNYYSEKLKKLLSRYMMRWFLDKRFIEEHERISLLIKRPEYNDKQYKEVISFYKDNAFEYMCNQKEIENVLKELVERYCEEYKL